MKSKLLFFAVIFSLTAFFIGVNLLTGCKKNVGVITNIVKYDISGFVLLSESFDAIVDVKIYLDRVSVATTDYTGKYIIPKLKPGSYLVKAEKNGYTKGQCNITVSSDGAIIKAILLQQLASGVTIAATGGSITAHNTSGNKTASLIIPSGELTNNEQISVTSIGASASPKKLPTTGNQILGPIVSINANNSNLSFTQGVTLTFNLVVMQKPGGDVGIQYFNETTNAWEAIPNAIASVDGSTASVILHHFSVYSATINGTYTETIDRNISSLVIAKSTNFNPQYEWQSTLEYRQNITNAIDPVWLYTTVECQTKHNFSTISYGSANSIVKTGKNISTITTPPSENPDGYRNYPKRFWELVKYTNWVYNTISINTWDIKSRNYVIQNIPSWYQSCFFVWVWRPDDSYAIPVLKTLNPPVSFVIVDQHYGGIGG